MFAAPYSGPGKNGPMIFDEAGNLVWFDPLAPNLAASNLQVQQYNGRPVLTWWQGYIPPQGFGQGEEVIDTAPTSSRARACGQRLQSGPPRLPHHPADTAVMTVFNPIDCNLSWMGGPSGGAVTDSVFQEIDLATASCAASGTASTTWASPNPSAPR